MENAFYFMSKAFYVREVFTCDFFEFVEKPLDKNYLDVWYQQVSPSNQRRLTHQTWKALIQKLFGRSSYVLASVHMRDMFLKNHTQNMMEKLVAGPFIKNQIWAYRWINSPKCYKVCFYCMSKSRSTKIY